MAGHTACGQHMLGYYLEQARQNSYVAQLARQNNILASHLYRQFRLTNKPSLGLTGNVPVYNKDNYAVTQPDGSIRFLPRSQNYSNIGLGFTQPLAATGGSFTLQTDLYRFDNFTDKTTQYNGTPVFIRFSQPILKYYPYKWGKLIESLKLQEAQLQQQADLRQTDYETCRLFFSIAEAVVSEELAVFNATIATTNLAAEKRRVQMGASTEDKALQLEMMKLNAEQQQAAAVLALQQAERNMNVFINSSHTGIRGIRLPEELPALNLNKDYLLAEARKNLPLYVSFERKKTETAAAIDEATRQGRQVDINASYGLNNAATSFSGVYRDPQSQQRFSIGFSIPLSNWGRSKNSIAIAKAKQLQTETENKSEDLRLIAEIENLIAEIPVLVNNINRAKQLDTLSEKRFIITNKLWQSGKVTLLELQAAQSEKDNSRKNYVIALRRFWETYYFLKIRTGL